MKREIKFRAWRTKDKSMAYNVDIDRYGKVPGAFASRDWPVMQFTGLKDKNEVEIYEGDIVQDSEGWRGYVDYRLDNNVAEYVITTNGEDGWYFWDSEPVEIIGNIYENLELIN